MPTPTKENDVADGPLLLAREDWPKTDHLITEDGKPLDGIYSDTQMRLLVSPLYCSWPQDQPFIACANVGVFYANRNPAVCPDVFVSLGVRFNPDQSTAAGQSYLMWDMGKPPDIVIEIVETTDGGELSTKRQIYAENVRAPYYVVWDPFLYLNGERLQTFILTGNEYQPLPIPWFPKLGLGLKPWKGIIDGGDAEWLRWFRAGDVLLETGRELRERAEACRRQTSEVQREIDSYVRQAETFQRLADHQKRKGDFYAAKLREMGIDPGEAQSQ